MENTGVRINKFLSEAGVCSRREADKFIEQGKVTIDGVVAEMGSRVFPGQKVTFNGKELKKQARSAVGRPRFLVIPRVRPRCAAAGQDRTHGAKSRS